MAAHRSGMVKLLRITMVVLAAALVLAAIFLGRPTLHVIRTMLRDQARLTPVPAGHIDDASRLNQTQMREVVDAPPETAAAERELAALLRRAAAEGLRVSVAGTRHTMGGHTIYPGGIALNMQPFDRFELDEKTNILHVQAGARWDQIIPYLDKRGRSIAIMQSNNSFTVGGSISANCHGWQPMRPPIAGA